MHERERIVILSIVQIGWFVSRFGLIDTSLLVYGLVGTLLSFILTVDVVNNAKKHSVNHYVWGAFTFIFGAIGAFTYLTTTKWDHS